MRPISNFIPVWEANSSRHPDTTTRHKRKRSLSEEEIDDAEKAGIVDENAQDSRRNAKSSQAKRDPYYVAGADPSQPLPPAPYPHGSGGSVKIERSLKHAVASPEVSRLSLHQQHVAAMTAAMHTSLLKGDFTRAGRAWGMLLRSSASGVPIDLRAHQRWSVGAEILLHKNSNSKSTEVDREGMQAAKDYYEQLILQYPYQRHLPHAINSLSFYPAMFGLMIYEATETSRRTISRLESASPEVSSPTNSERSDSSRNGEIADIKRSELDSATHIAARLDELILTPPFDHFVPLLQIRGMVALWTADLFEDLSSPLSLPKEKETDTEVNRLQPYVTRHKRDQNVERIKEERRKAQSFFRRVVSDGGTPPDTVKHMIE